MFPVIIVGNAPKGVWAALVVHFGRAWEGAVVDDVGVLDGVEGLLGRLDGCETDACVRRGGEVGRCGRRGRVLRQQTLILVI